jgi:hypothetical protein
MTGRETRLREFLAARRSRAFRPSGMDCAMLAADWVLEIAGWDPALRWRGQYRTLAEGRALIARDGYATPSDVLAPILVEGAGWMQARSGDIAVVIERGEEVLGIVGGGHVHAPQPGRGLGAVPLDRAIRIYRP